MRRRRLPWQSDVVRVRRDRRDDDWAVQQWGFNIKYPKYVTREKLDGWVYFIREEKGRDGGCWKIGYTGHHDVLKRVTSLQVGNPYPLKVELVTRGNRSVERELHKVFSGYQMMGEWFMPRCGVRQLVDFFKENGGVGLG